LLYNIEQRPFFLLFIRINEKISFSSWQGYCNRVSGCGYQTVERILQRAEVLFKEPIYGLLGGFHLPISIGKNITKHYQYYITNRLPWISLTETDILKTIVFCNQKGVQVVGRSGHDSCDKSIALFREVFRTHIDIVVGEKIVINLSPDQSQRAQPCLQPILSESVAKIYLHSFNWCECFKNLALSFTRE
jgi:hypothetical protein